METNDEIEPESSHTPENPAIRKKALSKVKRELSDEELTQSGVQKLLIQQTESLEDELKETKEYISKYHLLFSENSVLKEKINGSTNYEILHNFVLSMGGVLLGISGSFYNIEKSNWLFFLIPGAILSFGTLYIRWKK